MALGNGECKRRHIEWIETEWETPSEIGARVLVFPVNGTFAAAVYCGEGIYEVDGRFVSGEEFTHWAKVDVSGMEAQA